MRDAAHDLDTRIRAWLNSLANLTVAGSEPVTGERIATIAGMLGKDGLPSAAFTSDSLHAAAQGHRFFPAYDDIRKALHLWWDTNRPSSAPRLTGPNRDAAAELHGNDLHWFRHFQQRESEGFCPVREGTAPTSREFVLSLVKQQSLPAYRAITGERETNMTAPTDAAVAYVARLLRPEPGPKSQPWPMEAPAPIRPAANHIIGPALDAIRAKRSVRA